MAAPRPGHRARGSSTGRPIMVLLDLLGRRMSLRILWELRDRRLTFRALQDAAETNPSVLNLRLKDLRVARLVEHGAEGYVLTPLGKELLETFLPLHVWAEDWAKAVGQAHKPASHRRSAACR
jgi:DNA-binding HxlR family transcriptional regulator